MSCDINENVERSTPLKSFFDINGFKDDHWKEEEAKESICNNNNNNENIDEGASTAAGINNDSSGKSFKLISSQNSIEDFLSNDESLSTFSTEISSEEIQQISSIRPFFSRVEELLARRRESTARRTRELIEKEMRGATFRPSIDIMSKKLALGRYNSTTTGSVFERLSRKEDHKENNNNRLKTTTTTGEEINRYRENKSFDAFLQRADLYAQKRAERLKQIENEVNEQVAHQKGERKTAVWNGSPSPTIGKLLFRLSQKSDNNKPPMDYTFKPTLNKHSKSLAIHRNFESLLDDSCKKAEEMKRITRKSPTNVLKKRIPFDDVKRDPNRLYNHEGLQRKWKERELEKTRRQQLRDLKELDGCTFRPTINLTPIQKKKCNHSIMGLQKFLERAAMTRRLQEEKMIRQFQVWNGRCLLKTNNNY